MTILVNDAESTKIHAQSPSTKVRSGTFLIEVFDHFGLDNNDLISYQNTNIFGKGFASWWLLQYQSDKIPFRTQMRFLVTIKGRL
jgi:hypothetical protein